MHDTDKETLTNLIDKYGEVVLITNMAEICHEKLVDAKTTYANTTLANAYKQKERRLRAALDTYSAT